MSLKNVRDNRTETPTAGRASERIITDQVVPIIAITKGDIRTPDARTMIAVRKMVRNAPLNTTDITHKAWGRVAALNIEILAIVVRIREVRLISTDHIWGTAVQVAVLKWDIVDHDISSSASAVSVIVASVPAGQGAGRSLGRVVLVDSVTGQCPVVVITRSSHR
ncbi:MAG: hypothetical protein NT013_14315 [Planctomycetia bacterium]|nr:hypothetical protein [Planctomycetia bacterium]